jgi:hypothetical protein
MISVTVSDLILNITFPIFWMNGISDWNIRIKNITQKWLILTQMNDTEMIKL